ncbi:MAG: hypothetical protein JWQ01_1533 [Massilia sp.]|nr:hypothetical protein [Massilia sp.]
MLLRNEGTAGGRKYASIAKMKNLLAKTSAVAVLQWGLCCCATLLATVPAHAQTRDKLAELINAYRAAPGQCDGRLALPAPPLTPHPVLAGVQVATGAFLDQALERAGYPVARAQAIVVDGPADARAAMAAIEARYCKKLLSTDFSAVGAGRTGNSWLIVFAQPAAPSPLAHLPDRRQVGHVILQAVNVARAAGQTCGDNYYPAAPPLSWNEALGDAAFVHSQDMATQRYFNHRGKDGRVVGDRAAKAGYLWRAIGENIASGQESPEDAVAGWLSSPGHCANLMNPRFTDMGAAYAVNPTRASAYPYWTQVFGTPR